MIDLSKPRKHMMQRQVCSEGELGPSPVSPLSVVPDFVVSLVSDPVWHWSVLLDLLCKSNLLSECLYGTLKQKSKFVISTYHIPL